MNFTTYLAACIEKAKTELPNHIEPIDQFGEYKQGSKIKGFNYFTFTVYCQSQFQAYENISNFGLVVRDLALESHSADYNALQEQTRFAGMDMLD